MAKPHQTGDLQMAALRARGHSLCRPLVVDIKNSIAPNEGLDRGTHTSVWLPFSNSSHATVAKCTKGERLDWAVGPCYAPGVDGIRSKVRIFRPDCLFKRLAARTGDEVHRLQKVQSRDQAREAEWGATQGHLY